MSGGTGERPEGASAAPLAGRRVLVPRGGRGGELLAAEIANLGGEPVVVPLIATLPPADSGPLLAGLADWRAGAHDWLVVTSARGAEAVAAGLASGSGSTNGAAPGRIAAVGPATAAALGRAGLQADVVPASDFSAVGLAAALMDPRAGAAPGSRFLLALSEIAEPTLEQALRLAGHEVTRVDAYRTVAAHPDAQPHGDADRELLARGLDAVLVMSGSGARSLAARFAPLPERTAVIAIGQPTARALEAAGIRSTAIAREHTTTGLLRALVEYFEQHPQTRQAGRPHRPAEVTKFHPRSEEGTTE